MEFLRSIPGLPYYYAGVDGEIYSTKRGILKKLKATLSDKGYRKVRPMLDGKILTRKVAVLVCVLFMANVRLIWKFVMVQMVNSMIDQPM